MIGLCLRGNAAATASWADVDSDRFLGRAQIAKWMAMVCMAQKLLYHRTGVLAQVYVHFCVEFGMY